MVDSAGRKLVVCDNGTGFVKCGYGGSNFPDHIFPSIVGRPIIRAAAQVCFVLFAIYYSLKFFIYNVILGESFEDDILFFNSMT